MSQVRADDLRRRWHRLEAVWTPFRSLFDLSSGGEFWWSSVSYDQPQPLQHGGSGASDVRLVPRVRITAFEHNDQGDIFSSGKRRIGIGYALVEVV